MRIRHILLTCAALPLLSSPAGAQARRPTIQATPSADRAKILALVDQLDIPYSTFTLSNGLKVLVHTDRSVPQVNVGMWYDVGSKHEPVGRSGFAHLFEHLMFNGSENVPGDYMKPLMSVGAEVNGSTSQDRTNYYETVPTSALDRALFMESDRMGHLLGALDQATLDEQRGVVQNEKRQNDENPTSIIYYKTRAALYPAGHPYGHSTIGSMKDLNAATLDDVRAFFKAHYGPNNAMLILAGDVDLATARRLVTRYFGDIPAGPRNVRPNAPQPILTQTISETVTAPLVNPIVVRTWPVPGGNSEDAYALDGVMEVMGGGDDNVLTRELVRNRKMFRNVRVANQTSAQGGEFSIVGTVRTGVDVKEAASALDAEIARFLATPPSPDTVERFVARYTYGFARRLESVPARGSLLGEHAMAGTGPDGYKTALRYYATLTPERVVATARRWLGQPRYNLIVMPGPRVTPPDDDGIDGAAKSTAGTVTPKPATSAAIVPAVTRELRGPLPPVGPSPDVRFPAIEHARLNNGMPVTYSRFGASPFTMLSLRIAGGVLDEPADRTGTLRMMYDMLDDSFAGHDEHWIRQRKERLGVSLSAGSSDLSGGVVLDVPDTNLDTGLSMLTQMLTAPDFRQDTIDRLKLQTLDSIRGNKLQPDVLISKALDPLVNAGSPYNRLSIYDDPTAVTRITRHGIVDAFQRWVRPDRATLQIVSARPLAELLPLLNRSLGVWRTDGKTEPLARGAHPPTAAKPQIVLIDLPGAVQATVEGEQWIPIQDGDPEEALTLANRALGGGFMSRINMNLREDKHWTYGAYARPTIRRYDSRYSFDGTIQQDRIGAAIGEVMQEIRAVIGDRPVTADEFNTNKSALLGQTPMMFGNRYAVMAALADLVEYHRPDSYPSEAARRVRDVSLMDANAALRTQLAPDRWVWGIVGNAAIIRPQLNSLGLSVRVVPAADVLPSLP